MWKLYRLWSYISVQSFMSSYVRKCLYSLRFKLTAQVWLLLPRPRSRGILPWPQHCCYMEVLRKWKRNVYMTTHYYTVVTLWPGANSYHINHAVDKINARDAGRLAQYLRLALMADVVCYVVITPTIPNYRFYPWPTDLSHNKLAGHFNY